MLVKGQPKVLNPLPIMLTRFVMHLPVFVLLPLSACIYQLSFASPFIGSFEAGAML